MPAQIRICHMITTAEMGGAQLSTLRLLKGLAEKPSYKLTLLYGEEGPLSGAYKNIQGIEVFQTGLLRRPFNPLMDPLLLLYLIKFFKKHSVDILHTHCSKPSIVGRLAGIIASVPFIIHTYHGFGHDFFSNNLMQKLFIHVERILNKKSSSCLFVCKENLERAMEACIATANRNFIIPDLIDIESFVPFDKKNIRKEFPVIGSVLSFKEQKQPLKLLKLIHIINKTFPCSRFYLIGEGPLLDQTVKTAGRLGLKNITFTGAVNNIRDYYSQMDVYISASRYEGLSMAEIECLVLNIPMVLPHRGGIKYIMEHEKQGYFYPGDDLEKAASFVNEILSPSFSYTPVRSDLTLQFGTSGILNNYTELYSGFWKE